MRTITWHLSIGFPSACRDGEFEVEDDATEDEIDEIVKQEVHEYIDYGWKEEPAISSDSKS